MEHHSSQIAQTLKDGGVILYPTDTIYGLGCNAFCVEAVQRVFDIKQRKPEKPFILLASSLEQVRKYFIVEPIIHILKNLWPGSYTILLEPLNPKFFSNFTLDNKVAIRVPFTTWLTNLFSVWDGFLVSTSANKSGCIYTPDWDKLKEDFENQINLMCSNPSPLQNVFSSAILNWDSKNIDKPWFVIREGLETKAELLQKLKELCIQK